MRRRRIIIVLVGFVAVAAAAWLVTVWREPVYQGRRFGAWVKEFERALDAQETIFVTPAAVSAELQAFRGMGPEAVPLLLKMVRARDSWLKQRVMQWADTRSWDWVRLTPAAQRRNTAFLILQGMGPEAHNAVPELIKLLSDPEVGSHVEETLPMMGELAAASLREVLKSGDHEMRRAAVRTFGNIAAATPDTVESLTALLTDPDAQLRASAVSALAKFGPVSQTAAPALEACLNDPVQKVRGQAARALGAIVGPDDRMVAVMRRLLVDGDIKPDAACALSGMGNTGAGVLTMALTNEIADVCVAAAAGLALHREQQKPLYMTNAENRRHFEARWSVLYNMKFTQSRYLSQMLGPGGLAARALVENLRDTNEAIRQLSLQLVSRFTNQTASVSNALSGTLADHDPSVREAARQAMRNLGLDEQAIQSWNSRPAGTNEFILPNIPPARNRRSTGR